MTGQLQAETLSPHVFRIAVPTLTLPPLDQTNTYVIQSDTDAIIVDCGSNQEDTVREVATLIRDRGVSNVVAYLLTHYHIDHAQGIPLLQTHFPAPVFVHPLDQAGAAKELGCSPSDLCTPPDTMRVGKDVVLRIMHRPGHTHGHLHIMVERDNLLTVGDHMAGVGTVWIGPPDGHMKDYYRSLREIISSEAHLALPGHGDPISQPQNAARELLKHRLGREEQIALLLEQGPRMLDEIVTYLYGDRRLGAALWVATRTTQAHLEHLMDIGRVCRRCQAPDFKMYYALTT